MDENIPPAISNNKTLLGSPLVSGVLKPSNKENLVQSPNNQNLKVLAKQSPKLPLSPANCIRYDIVSEVEAAELWTERVSSLTPNDHQDYVAFAVELIRDIVNSLPMRDTEPNPTADSDDDEIQFQPRSYTFDENTDPFQSKGGLSNSPSKSCSANLTDDAKVTSPGPTPPSLDQNDSVLTSMLGIEDSEVAKKEDTTQSQEAVSIMPDDVKALPSKSNDKVQNSPAKVPGTGLGTLTGDNGLPETLEDVDPFKPKTQIMNSPSQNSTINSTMEADLTVIENLPEDFDDIDPFKSKSQVENSPVKVSKDEILKDSNATEEISPENLNQVDPFQTKSQVQNSPVKTQQPSELPANLDDIDPFKPKTQMQNSPVKTLVDDTSSKLPELPENLEDVDPFKPKCQMQNSPVKVSDEPLTSKLELPGDLDEIDPFKPKKQVENSPAKVENTVVSQTLGLPENLDDIDPFKPKSQMPNSPVKTETPENKISCAVELPENLDEIDPFKPKVQMQNSPVKAQIEEKVSELPENLDDIDPFKPKKQMQNSPVKSSDVKSETSLSVLPDNLNGIDPFKPKTQMQNSPVNLESVEVSKPTELPENLDDIDPFQPKKQMMNSPVKDEAAPPKVAKLPDNLDDIDPFKPKTQMQNSPVKPEVFSGQSVIPEFPDNLDDIDPFKTKTQMVNSPVNLPENLDEIDPFKPKTQMQNSPPKMQGLQGLEDDPFKTPTPNAPVSKIPVNPVEKDNSGADAKSADPFDNLDAFNPFQNLTKLGNTPNKNAGNLPHTPKNFVPGGFDLGSNLMCMIAPESKGSEAQEDDFRPANEVFSDPNVWDMLEKFGNSNTNNAESDLARMSLYVKFDPLVDSKTDSPSAGALPGIARGLQKMELVKDGDESIMLMGTPPRGGGRRRSILVQRRPPPAVAKTIFEEESAEETKPAKTHLVDLIFSCSPESNNAPKESGASEEKPSAASPTLPKSEAKDETFFEVVEVLKYSETDMKRKLDQLKKELLMQAQGRQLSLEQELSKKQTVLSTEAKILNDKVKELETKNKEMKQVVVEYETFINELVSEKEKNTSESKECKIKLKTERDQAIEDLQSVEKSFADLHRRYEKMKAVIEDYRKNEETLKKTNQSLIAKMQTQDETLNKLKTQAESKLKQVHEEKEKEKSTSSADIMKLTVSLKKSELHVQSLEKTLEQKGKEMAELTDLCDTLIAKVGGS